MNNLSSYVSYHKGYSLIEILIVITIISVLALIAYPSMIHFLQSMESKRIENELRQLLRQARNESFITKQNVILCAADETKQCHRTAQYSLLIFIDNNRNGRIDDNETAIHQSINKLKYGTLSVNASLHRHYMRYQGNTSRPTGHFGHIKYCSYSDNKRLSFKLILNAYGKIRIERNDLVNIGC